MEDRCGNLGGGPVERGSWGSLGSTAREIDGSECDWGSWSCLGSSAREIDRSEGGAWRLRRRERRTLGEGI